MVKLPDTIDIGTRLPNAVRGQPNYPTSNPIAGALQGFGNTLSSVAFNAAGMVNNEADKTRQLGVQSRFLQFEDEWNKASIERAEMVQPGAAGFTDTLKKDYAGAAKTFFKSIPEELRPVYDQRLFELESRLASKATTFEREEKDRYAKGQIEDGQGVLLSRQAGNPDNWQEVEREGEELIRSRPGASPVEADEEVRKWRKRRAMALFETRRAQDAAGAIAGLGAGSVVDRIIQVESGGAAGAQNPNSSAGGLGGFTDSTWVATVRKHRPDIAAGMSNDDIIGLKTEGPLAREILARHTEDNAAILERNGIAVTPSNLYLVHFAGEGGGPKILTASDDTPVAGVLSADAIRANPEVLGGGKTVGDVKRWAERKMGDGSSSAVVPTNMPDVTSANAFLKTRLGANGPDHIDGMQPQMQQRLAALIQSAPPEIAGKLGVFSGARSVARQQELWAAAVARYGSPSAARKWVAPPGRSNHNHGKAADLSYGGQSLAKAPADVVAWVHSNAGKFGLKFPLANENWHIEMEETRGGASPSGGFDTSILSDPAPEYAALSYEDRLGMFEKSLADERNRQKEMSVVAHGQIETTIANAPAAIQNTGSYDGEVPSLDKFVLAYGPDDGVKKFDAFTASMEVSQQAYDFRAMSTAEIEQAVEDAAPVSSGDDAALQADKYRVLQGAADTVINARNADPAAYAQQVFPSVAQAWEQAQAATGDEQIPAMQTAMSQTAAAQRQLGVANMRLLPGPVADQSVMKFKDEALPEQERIDAVAGLVFSTADPEQRLAVFDQLVKAGLPEITAGAIRASARGDTGAAQRLFEAAMVDISKLPGKVRETLDMIDLAIQAQLMDVNQIGDVYYGLSDGSAENIVAAQRDSKLMVNAVSLRLRKGESLDAAVDGVAKDLFGDVKPLSGANVSILVPSDADERVVLSGLDAMQPKVREALERALTIPAEVGGADNALMKATRANEIQRLMLDGYWRNAGDGYAFLDPMTGFAVADENGNPLIFTEEEVMSAGTAPREVRRQATQPGAMDPAQPLTDDAFDNFQKRMGVQ